ncbi:hypothetical protein BDV96DRAFT_693284 [Lophiotrema nucula]|uniref:WSC domain-containing protein n=1 Tax=Lophiotrema nucula TaxID=690887 RepID=A0A6A5YKB4_9PLEO|nr:hypothetical protein BDV96DRAFT_693284 [Lophiotrema nucula]
MAKQASSAIFSLVLTLLSASIRLILAVEVTPDSPCSNFCINRPGLNVSDYASSQTFSGDLSCLDSDYMGENSTAIGRKFRSCVSCEQTSNTVDVNASNENDVYWFLFNLKSTIGWCVNGFFETEQNPNVTLANTECSSSCDGISKAILDQLRHTNQTLQYNYCEADNAGFLSGVDECKACLNGVENLRIMGNFLDALVAACHQRPALGATISLATNVFSTTLPTQSSVSTATSEPASTNSNSMSSSDSPTSMPGSVIGGIVVGAIAGLVLIVLLIFIVLRRRRRSVLPKAYEVCGENLDSPRAAVHSKQDRSKGFAISAPMELGAEKAPAELDGGSARGPKVRVG